MFKSVNLLNEMNFTKEQTEITKGVAITLMFIHHLYGFSDRLLNNNSYLPLIPGIDLESHLASFGKICVPIFIFLSSYGMYIGYSRIPKTAIFSYVFKKVQGFYLTYWRYFFIFIPIGIVFFANVTLWESEQIRYDPSPSKFFLNLIGWNYDYNGEWWFVRVFLIMLILLFPGYAQLAKYNHIFTLIFLSLAMRLTLSIFPQWGSQDALSFMIWQTSFMAGIVCAKWQFFSHPLIQKLDRLHPIGSIVGLGIIFLIQQEIGNKINFLLVPFFIIFCIKLVSVTKLAPYLSYLGKYSFPLWLVHPFFCYYYGQDLIYWPQWSPLILLLLIFVSLGSVLAIEWLWSQGLNQIGKFY